MLCVHYLPPFIFMEEKSSAPVAYMGDIKQYNYIFWGHTVYLKLEWKNLYWITMSLDAYLVITALLIVLTISLPFLWRKEVGLNLTPYM
jgi:hypothetical protein